VRPIDDRSPATGRMHATAARRAGTLTLRAPAVPVRNLVARRRTVTVDTSGPETPASSDADKPADPSRASDADRGAEAIDLPSSAAVREGEALPAPSGPQLPVAPAYALWERGRRRGRWFALALALLVAAVLVGWWTLLRAVPLEGFAVGNGRVEATEIDLATKIPGCVEAVLFEEGDAVEAGAVVARIDVAALRAQRDEAQAALAQATQARSAAAAALERQRSQLELARSEFERARRLFDADTLSRDELDRRRTQLDVARASVEEARGRLRQAESGEQAAAARVRRLQVDIEDATLRAPVRGRVLYRLAEPGEVLPAGGKVVALIDESDTRLEIFLPEDQAARVAMRAEGRVWLDGFPSRYWPATVSYVSPEAQFTPKYVETRSERGKLSFKVKLQLAQPADPLVKPGMRGVGLVRLDPEAAWPDRAP